LERDEIERLGGNTQAVLMLDAGEGFTFSPTLTGKQVVSPSPKTKGMHGQMPDRPGLGATFIIAGPGIAPGHTLSEMRMIDVAPTLAATVGLKMPKAEGQVVSEVFTTSKSPQTK
jgi:predicted AlkP superfamily pyrophosphatase or phosphodiesterase